MIVNYRKPAIFISFDVENDQGLKNDLIAESQKADSLFQVHSTSTNGNHTDKQWLLNTRQEINAVDKLVVILGPKTSNNLKVAREVDLGMECNKPIAQLRIQGTDPNPMPMLKWNYVYIWEEKAFIQAFRPIEILDQ